MKVAIVGASGFVGQRLCRYLLEHTEVDVLALSRNPFQLDNDTSNGRFNWQSIDLHNLLSIESVLVGVDVAVYLVHSMLPSARMNQGAFQDFDLSLADNFARAAKTSGVRQIVYLGGLIPESGTLSLHLRSRLEVEHVFQQYIPQTTVIRAGLILGESGSSFTIMLRLVQRLPVMVCPVWTTRKSHPVFIDDIVIALSSVLLRPEHFSKVYDIGMDDSLSYLEMMARTARLIRRSPRFYTLPVFTPTLSRLWVRLVTGAPKSLVYPLIESLRDDMLVRPEHRLPLPGKAYTGFDETLQTVLSRVEQARDKQPYAFKPRRSLRGRRKTVRSIQRLPMPAGVTARWVADAYIRWLAEFLPWLLKTQSKGNLIDMQLRGLGWSLLRLKFSDKRSTADRCLFYIVGGLLLSRHNERGRLEMRATLANRVVIAAVHDFVPALPWVIYRFTQAKFHALVMKQFGKYLLRLDQSSRSQTTPLRGT